MNKWSILLPTLAVMLLLWIEQVLEVTYLYKTVGKVLIFLAVAFYFLNITKLEFFRLKNTKNKNNVRAIGFGILVMISILITFYILQNFININSILSDLKSRVGVTSTVFPFVALYILFGNSFLEEFFFRGLLVDLYKESKLKWFLPSFFFSIYHIAIFLPWFEWPILLTAVGGLFMGGMLVIFPSRICNYLPN
ncbi:MAG: type II CAAX prenyl endopeptidase Rce1 family protein [Paenisporosarcina sp.]